MQDGRGRGDEILASSTGEREKDKQENTHGQRSDGVDGTPVSLCVTHDCGVDGDSIWEVVVFLE